MSPIEPMKDRSIIAETETAHKKLIGMKKRNAFESELNLSDFRKHV